MDKETTQDTQQIYQRAGMDGRMGFGRKPAVLVVDLSIGFTSPESPLGGDLSAVLSANRRIIDRAREKLVPVIFTTVAFDENFSDAGVWMEKIPTLKVLVKGSKLVDIHPDLGRRADEPVIVKQGASAFFGTSLSARLTYLGVDTIILTGATTSGCVRATAIDCLQYNYRTIVPVECVGDRAQGPHEANLFDIGAKYADNVSVEVVLKYLDGFSASDGALIGHGTDRAKENQMSHKGKTQLTIVIVAPPDQVAEGERIFKSHAPWIEKTHHRSGDKALLEYTV